MIIKTHKIRIYPNSHNQKVFEKYYHYSRSVWNRAIIERKNQYAVYKKMKENSSLTKKELNKQFYPNIRNLRKMKKEKWEYDFHNKIRDVQFARLCQAWDNYFNPAMPNHKKPKMKKKKHCESKQFVGFKEVKFKDKWMFLPNARTTNSDCKFTPIRMKEAIRFDGVIVDDFIISNESGKWFVTVTVKLTEKEPIKITSKKATGVDVNVKQFDFVKNIDKDGNAEFDYFSILDKKLMNHYKKIKYYNKVLSKKRNKNSNYQESNSYKKAKAKLNRCYFRATCYQEDKLNKFIHYLFNNYQTITIEDLDVQSMKMNKRICKSLHRACFGKFKTKMLLKQQEYTTILVVADRFFPSTQTCSHCGHIKQGEDKLGLFGDRFGNAHHEYVCYECGCVSNRDGNAVMNLLHYGLTHLAA